MNLTDLPRTPSPRTVGVVVTRAGVTDAQEKWLYGQLDGVNFLHHGGALGDEVAHLAAIHRSLGMVIHPPLDPAHAMRLPGPYPARAAVAEATGLLAAARSVVDSTYRLLALPGGPERACGSRTWLTVHYAVSQRRPVLICHPDGRVDQR